jgi:prolyl 4-hydroxylase
MMDQNWIDWTAKAVAMGCNIEELRGILVKNGFTPEDIANHLDARVASISPMAFDAINYEALTRIKITRTATKVATDLAQVYTLDDFMSAYECDTLARLSKQNLYHSKVANASVEGYVDASSRTSKSYDLYESRHPLIAKIDARIAKTIGLNIAYSDITQIQHYSPGQEFKPHFDYYTPGTESYQSAVPLCGNRTWTFMVYLNTTKKGGGTHFPKLNTILTNIVYSYFA